MSSYDIFEKYSPFAKILDEFINVLRELPSPAERKLLMISGSEAIEDVKWWGLPALTEKILEDLRQEQEDAILLSLICRFLIKKNKDLAIDVAEELLKRITELSEWEFDRAVSLYNVALAMYYVGELSLSKKYIMEALKWAKSVPDRSDRSISLSSIVPLLYKLGDKSLALTLIDDIVYEPKKIDAILNLAKAMDENDNENLKILLSKAPKDQIPHIIATYADTISPKTPEKVYALIKKALSTIGSSESILAVNVMLKAYSAFSKIDDPKFKNLANQLFDTLIKQLLTKTDDRPYLNALFELLNISAVNDPEKTRQVLGKIEDLVSQKNPPENLYMLNRIGFVYFKLNELEKAANAIGLSLELSKDADKIVAIPSVIDAGAILIKIMNEFPPDIPEELVESYIEMIKPMEYMEVAVRLSNENFEFLKRVYTGLSLNDAINAIILKERIYESFEIDRKAKDIIYALIDRDEYIIIHYILKYIYSVGLDENERLSILNMLGRITELLTSGMKDMAKTYLDLIFTRLQRLNLPLMPVLIEYMREYMLATTLNELL